jgi:hypothetical protein
LPPSPSFPSYCRSMLPAALALLAYVSHSTFESMEAVDVWWALVTDTQYKLTALVCRLCLTMSVYFPTDRCVLLMWIKGYMYFVAHLLLLRLWLCGLLCIWVVPPVRAVCLKTVVCLLLCISHGGLLALRECSPPLTVQ